MEKCLQVIFFKRKKCQIKRDCRTDWFHAKTFEKQRLWYICYKPVVLESIIIEEQNLAQCKKRKENGSGIEKRHYSVSDPD
jgi:hypothetical protein